MQGPKWPLFYSHVDPVWSLYTVWYRLYLGRAPRTKETLPDFSEWCRVTRRPRIFRGLTGCQRDPWFWGVTVSHKGYVCYDLCSNKFCIFCHVVFFENQSFFSTHVESLLEMLALPNFDELNPTQERFNPDFVYQR